MFSDKKKKHMENRQRLAEVGQESDSKDNKVKNEKQITDKFEMIQVHP